MKHGPRVDWQAVDWSRGTAELALETGRDVSEVSHRRRQFAPHTVRVPVADWQSMDWTLRNADIVRLTGAAASTVGVARRRWAPLELQGKRGEWQDIDWSQPNARIAEQMGVVTEFVQRQRRKYAPEAPSLALHQLAFSAPQLRFWREKRGWSQAQCEQWIGVGRNRMSEWESGFRSPDATNTLRLCLLLNIHARDLCERATD